MYPNRGNVTTRVGSELFEHTLSDSLFLVIPLLERGDVVLVMICAMYYVLVMRTYVMCIMSLLRHVYCAILALPCHAVYNLRWSKVNPFRS